jgi:hypothetical protein
MPPFFKFLTLRHLSPRKKPARPSLSPPCLLSTPPAAAAPPGKNQSRCCRFNPLMVSSNLRPSSSSAIGPSSLPVPPHPLMLQDPPKLVADHRSPPAAVNCCCIDRTPPSLSTHHYDELSAASPCPVPPPLHAQALGENLATEALPQRRRQARRHDTTRANRTW